jgi:hypothetical protein
VNLLVIVVLFVSLREEKSVLNLLQPQWTTYFNSGLGNTVQITLSALCDAAASLILILLQDANLLESLHDLAVYASGSIDVVGWAGATVAGRAVGFAHATNTDSLSEVDMTSNRSGTNVEPIDRLRWELLRWASLDSVNPT